MYTTPSKCGKRRRNKITAFEDSTAKSRLFSIEKELGLEGLFEGEVYHLSFDCPRPLAKAFKQATHDNGTSVCKELQKYALTYVVNNHIEKSAYGNTLSKVLKPKLTIQNLNFEQYCQTKPRRWIRKSPEELKGVNGAGCKFSFCMIGDCGKPAVTVMVYIKTGKDYQVCDMHSRKFSECGSDVWRLKQNVSASSKGVL